MAADDDERDAQATEQAADPVTAARAKLREAAAKQTFGKERPATKTDQIRALRHDINRLRSKGATWQEVAAIIADVISVKPDTIRQIMLATPKAKKTKKKETAARAVGTQAPKQSQSRENPDAKPTGHDNLSREY